MPPCFANSACHSVCLSLWCWGCAGGGGGGAGVGAGWLDVDLIVSVPEFTYLFNNRACSLPQNTHVVIYLFIGSDDPFKLHGKVQFCQQSKSS